MIPQFQTKTNLEDLRLKTALGPLTFHKQIADSKKLYSVQGKPSPAPTSAVVVQDNEQEKVPQRVQPGPLRETGLIVLPEEQNRSPGRPPLLGQRGLQCPPPGPSTSINQQLLYAFFSLPL